MQLTDSKPITDISKQHLLNLVHVLLAHEAEAAEEYNNIVESLDTGFDEVREMLEEVRRDERNHIGVLLRCIEILDKREADEISEEK